MGTKNWKPEQAPQRFSQIPPRRGIVFVCLNCSRPTATGRDAVLRAWGERGIIADVACRLRCRWCKKRGMEAALTPLWVGVDFGSKSDFVKLLDAILNVKPIGTIE